MALGTRLYLIIGLVAVLAFAAVAVTASSQLTSAQNGGDDDNDVPITGAALQQASDAALAHTGGGDVSDTEVGDEDSFYEVEVTLADGSEIDIQLDESFNVVGEEADNDSGGDKDGDGDND